DIVEFISCKDDLGELTNFNISVAVTDEFMRAAEADAQYELKDPRTRTAFVIDGQPALLNAREVLDKIVDHAHKTGEPGIIFLDRMNDGNPVTKIAHYEATNPCGEQPLLPYESCNLGSLNLSKMVKAVVDLDSRHELSRYEIDWEKLDQTVRLSVHFLDNVIEANRYPLPEIDENTRKHRKIGLGVMGWADLLILLGIRYDSQEALDLAEKIMSRVKHIAHDESRRLAEARGVFPSWESSSYYRGGAGPKMRNSTVTTIAPTGTISIIAGCSSGIEPLFAVSYVRNVMDQTRLVEVNPHFERVARTRGFYSKEFMETISRTNSIAGYDEIPDDVKNIFVTTHDISPEWHVRMQAAFQKYTDNAVSKTINLPNNATVGDVQKAYLLSYKLGCKGITIYRDGSRAEQVLSTKSTASEKLSPEKAAVTEERPEILSGITEKIKTGYGNLYVTINVLNGRPFEVFASIGKSGYSTMADTEAICRLISLSLRSGVPVENVISQLKGIGGASPVFGNGGLISSIPDAIAQVLHKHFGNGVRIEKEFDIAEEFCPDCGARTEHDGGCLVCRSCGYSKC
ncbi:MAG: adenosylcobalamin-dependent ribonucleoside-diphosphate reductase, partial [Candidatus Zixiibacteriota bacterium]